MSGIDNQLRQFHMKNDGTITPLCHSKNARVHVTDISLRHDTDVS